MRDESDIPNLSELLKQLEKYVPPVEWPAWQRKLLLSIRDAAEKIPGARGAWMQLRFSAEAAATPSEQPPIETRTAAE